MTRARAFAVGLVLVAWACVAQAGLRRVEAGVHDTVLLVEFLPEGHCTAVKIKPQKPGTSDIRLAAHCVAHKPEQVLIGKVPVDVLEIVEGPGDQAKVTLAAELGRYASVGVMPEQGDDVFVFGNPGEKRDLLRRGYIAGTNPDGTLIADMVIAGGDSGAPVFNARGQLVAIVTSVTIEHTGMWPTLHMSVLQPVAR